MLVSKSVSLSNRSPLRRVGLTRALGMDSQEFILQTIMNRYLICEYMYVCAQWYVLPTRSCFCTYNMITLFGFFFFFLFFCFTHFLDEEAHVRCTIDRSTCRRKHRKEVFLWVGDNVGVCVAYYHCFLRR